MVSLVPGFSGSAIEVIVMLTFSGSDLVVGAMSSFLGSVSVIGEVLAVESFLVSISVLCGTES